MPAKPQRGSTPGTPPPRTFDEFSRRTKAQQLHIEQQRAKDSEIWQRLYETEKERLAKLRRALEEKQRAAMEAKATEEERKRQQAKETAKRKLEVQQQAAEAEEALRQQAAEAKEREAEKALRQQQEKHDQHPYVQFIRKNILTALQEEINRLGKDTKSSFFKKSGEAKRAAIEAVKGKIEKKIETPPPENYQAIHNSIVDIVRKASKNKTITGYRNKTAGFFKGLLGVLLAVPATLLIVPATVVAVVPPLRRKYHYSFFCSRSEVAFLKMKRTLCAKRMSS